MYLRYIVDIRLIPRIYVKVSWMKIFHALKTLSFLLFCTCSSGRTRPATCISGCSSFPLPLFSRPVLSFEVNNGLVESAMNMKTTFTLRSHLNFELVLVQCIRVRIKIIVYT